MKEVGPVECLRQPDPLERGLASAFGPDRYRQRTAMPIYVADRSIDGFARGAVIPGLRSKCAHGRSQDAATSVISVTRV
jgi:hypothetical protein